MNSSRILDASVLVISIAICLESVSDAQTEVNKTGWAQWRGPLATGESPHADPPIKWSESENVKWKTNLPGKGHSSPVVWNDFIFVTSAEPFGDEFPGRYSGAPGAHDNLPVSQQHRFLVIAISRDDGRILWQNQVHSATPHEGAHYSGSLASASPITDGNHVYASFGSYGLYCLDFDGKLVWKKALGTMNSKHGHGEGSTPVLHNKTLIVSSDHEGQSYIVALNADDGKEIWRRDRDEVTSWSSPIVVAQGSSVQVIVAGTNRVRAYDINNGEVIWQCGGLSHNVVATPVAADGMVFVGSSYDTRAMFAIRLDGARGDITGTNQVVWSTRQRTPYVPSPLLYRGSLYFLRHYQGILTRLEAKTGEEKIGPFRLRGLREIYASPVAAAGRIYISDRDGVTIVFSHTENTQSDVPQILSMNKIDDSINGSLALIDNQIIMRGEKNIYCIESKQPRK